MFNHYSHVIIVCSMNLNGDMETWCKKKRKQNLTFEHSEHIVWHNEYRKKKYQHPLLDEGLFVTELKVHYLFH